MPNRRRPRTRSIRWPWWEVCRHACPHQCLGKPLAFETMIRTTLGPSPVVASPRAEPQRRDLGALSTAVMRGDNCEKSRAKASARSCASGSITLTSLSSRILSIGVAASRRGDDLLLGESASSHLASRLRCSRRLSVTLDQLSGTGSAVLLRADAQVHVCRLGSPNSRRQRGRSLSFRACSEPWM